MKSHGGCDKAIQRNNQLHSGLVVWKLFPLWLSFRPTQVVTAKPYGIVGGSIHWRRHSLDLKDQDNVSINRVPFALKKKKSLMGSI